MENKPLSQEEALNFEFRKAEVANKIRAIKDFPKISNNDLYEIAMIGSELRAERAKEKIKIRLESATDPDFIYGLETGLKFIEESKI